MSAVMGALHKPESPPRHHRGRERDRDRDQREREGDGTETATRATSPRTRRTFRSRNRISRSRPADASAPARATRARLPREAYHLFGQLASPRALFSLHSCPDPILLNSHSLHLLPIVSSPSAELDDPNLLALETRDAALPRARGNAGGSAHEPARDRDREREWYHGMYPKLTPNIATSSKADRDASLGVANVKGEIDLEDTSGPADAPVANVLLAKPCRSNAIVLDYAPSENLYVSIKHLFVVESYFGWKTTVVRETMKFDASLVYEGERELTRLCQFDARRGQLSLVRSILNRGKAFKSQLSIAFVLGDGYIGLGGSVDIHVPIESRSTISCFYQVQTNNRDESKI
ncbi:hypothetical protein DFH06DRAFT_1474473, partial [Mycena polygramma]